MRVCVLVAVLNRHLLAEEKEEKEQKMWNPMGQAPALPEGVAAGVTGRESAGIIG